MIIKTLELCIYIEHSNSLKDKRRVLKSMTQRLRQKFNISVAELDYLDSYREALIGIVIVSNDQSYSDKVLDQCLNLIETEYDLEVVEITKEIR